MSKKAKSKALSRAMKGNKNAIGNKGGKGAPVGNIFAEKTGEYSKITFATLSDEEKNLTFDTSPTEILNNEIFLFTVRENRMLKLIKNLIEQKEIAEIETIKDGKGRTIREVKYIRLLSDKILDVENALTRVQEKKIRAIESREKILQNQKELELKERKLKLEEF